MSRIDELVERLCPDGVEYKPLGEVGSFVRGSGLQKKDLANSGFPAIHYGQIHTHYGVWTDEAISFVDPAFARKLRKAEPGDLLIATTSEDDQAVAKSVAWLGSTEVAISGDSFAYHHTLDPKFVSYYFQSAEFQDQKKLRITGTKVRRISASALSMIRVPVPPLEIQTEIVRVLDRLTSLERELETELEAELEARRRQFDHYRGELLTFASGTPRRVLSELARNLDSRRKPVTKDARTVGDVPYYGASGVVDYVSDYIFDSDYLLVSEDGANLLARSTPIAFSISGKTWVNNHAHVLEFDTYSERRFVEIYLNSIDLSPFISGVSQPKLNKANLNRIPIPDPTAGEKKRMVALLDRFEALVNDLSIGLPAELVARRQQYEYYRDRLLTFKEKAS